MKATVIVLFIFCSAVLSAQTISGIVTDKDGNPLPGANVYIENTFTGTSTDANGKYAFSFKDTGTFVLMTEFVGFNDHRQNLHLTG